MVYGGVKKTRETDVNTLIQTQTVTMMIRGNVPDQRLRRKNQSTRRNLNVLMDELKMKHGLQTFNTVCGLKLWKHANIVTLPQAHSSNLRAESPKQLHRQYHLTQLQLLTAH